MLSIALAPVPGVLLFVATCRRSFALCMLLGCCSGLRQSSEIVNMSYCSSICPLVLFGVNMSYCSSICPLVLLGVYMSYCSSICPLVLFGVNMSYCSSISACPFLIIFSPYVVHVGTCLLFPFSRFTLCVICDFTQVTFFVYL